jgi:hypothetical protein
LADGHKPGSRVGQSVAQALCEARGEKRIFVTPAPAGVQVVDLPEFRPAPE